MTGQELYDLAVDNEVMDVARFIAYYDTSVVPVGQSPVSLKGDWYEDATYA